MGVALDLAAAWMMADDADFDGVQEADLRSISYLLRAWYGWGDGIVTSMTDEWGWSSTDSPIVMWEEGPEEWVYSLPESVKAYAAMRGLVIEPATSWAVVIYLEA
jgi:hypothetical protein